MKILMLLSLFTLGACAPGGSIYQIGKTTRADIVAQKGQPVSEEKIPVKEGSILVYENNEKFQLKADVLAARFRDPSEHERPLIYWQHQFKDCQSTRTVVNKSDDKHTRKEIELSCPEKGLSVIFLEDASFVERVVEYAK